MALASEDDSPNTNALNFSMASDIVELVVLTGDEILLQTMRDAVGGSRRLWHAVSADKVSDLLVAGEVGIVVIDVAALRESAAVFVSEIKRQFPDMVVLVAGGRDTELELASLISAGTVYRFIHKPLSPARARLFAEAAVRRYGERRRTLLTRPPERRRTASAWPLVAIGVAALLALISVLVLSLRSRPAAEPTVVPGPPPAGSVALAQILGRAAAALAANRLTAPPAGDNALELYLQASALAPADAAARTGLADVRERLLARAENALLEERLDEAAAAIETARRSGVEASRTAFLSAQLVKSREQLRSAQGAARAARAQIPASAPAPSMTSAQIAAANAERANVMAGLAVERIAQGKLLEPEKDNARHYVEEALRLDPNGDPVAEARQTLAARLLIEARAAIDRRDFARAAGWLQSAEGIALPVNIDASRSLLNIARQQAQGDGLAQLLKNGSERLREDRLIEPAGDSAKYYLTTLHGVDAQYAGLAAALSELGAKLVAKARLALTLQQYNAARSWLDEAAGVGYEAPDAASVARELDEVTRQKTAAAQSAAALASPSPAPAAPPAAAATTDAAPVAATAAASLPDLLPASQLTLLKSVQPIYPSMAQADRLEGWVEVEFTVGTSGQVTGTAVSAASPKGVFDQAALRAVAQWRYQPVERGGQAVPVRSRVRIRFTP